MAFLDEKINKLKKDRCFYKKHTKNIDKKKKGGV